MSGNRSSRDDLEGRAWCAQSDHAIRRGRSCRFEAASNLVGKGGTIVSPGLGSGPWNVNVGRMSFNNVSLLGMWGGNIDHLDDIARWMQEGRLDIKPMLQAMPLSEWREAFDMLRRQECILHGGEVSLEVSIILSVVSGRVAALD